MKRIFLLLLLALASFFSQAQVKLLDYAAPNGSSDVYPTHKDIYGSGGLRTVATITERNAITAERRTLDMIVIVQADHKWYQLKNGLTNSDWVEVTFGGLETDPVWTAAIINYYTKTNLQTSGQALVHWGNVTNAPSFLTSLAHNHGVANSLGSQQFTYGVGDNVRYAGSGNVSVSFDAATKTVTFTGTAGEGADGNNYPSAMNFSTGSGVFTLSRDGLPDLTQNLDGRYSLLGHTHTETDPVWLTDKIFYYTKTNMQTSGSAALHWNNLTNIPAYLLSAPTLQSVTTAGNKTTKSVSVKSLATNKLTADSTGEPDFTLAVFPDIQGMTFGNTDMLNSMFDWVVDNKEYENIKGLIQLGDLTDRSFLVEWPRVATEFDKLDGAGVPYLTVMGNHDYDGGEASMSRLATKYNTYMGESRMGGKSYYGGNYLGSYENYYIKYDVGSVKLLVIGLEFLPRDGALTWAKSICDDNPDRKAIVVTHAYQSAYGELAEDSTLYSGVSYGMSADNSGVEMWNKFVRKCPNIVLVLNGHFIDRNWEGNGYVQRRTAVGDSGNVVQQIFVNYQRDGNGTDPDYNTYGNLGNAYFMKLRISPSKNKIYSSFYSPYFDTYDNRQDSFNLDLPSIQVESAVGTMGGVYTKQVRTQSLYVDSIGKYNVPFVGVDNKLQGTTAMQYKAGVFTAPKINATNLVSQRVVLAGTAGQLTSNANLTYTDALNLGWAGNDELMAVTGNTNTFMREAIYNTSSGSGALAGIRMVNDVSTSLQLAVGSSGSAFVPNGVLIRTNAGVVMNIVTNAGYTRIGTNEVASDSTHTTARFLNNNTTIIGKSLLYNTGKTLQVVGSMSVSGLGGTGTRMVVADADGVISTQAIPSGGGGYTFTGTTSQYTKGDGSYGTFPTAVSSFTNDAGYLTSQYWTLSGSDLYRNSNVTIGGTSIISAKLGIKGAGTTSSTTALSIQNSSATEVFNIRDNGTIYAQSLAGSGTTKMVTVETDGRITIADIPTGGGAGTLQAVLTAGNTSTLTGTVNGWTTYDFHSIGDAIFDGGVAVENNLTVNSGKLSVGTLSPSASSIVDLVSTTKGVLLPRLTATQVAAVSSPANGLLVYETTDHKFAYYNGTDWTLLATMDDIPSYSVPTLLQVLTAGNVANNIALTITGTGSIGAPRVSAANLQAAGTGVANILAPTASTNYDAVMPSKTSGSTQTVAMVSDLTGTEATTASSSTPAPTGDARDNYLDVTALAANATVSAPSGTAANHNRLLLRIKDNGTARTLAWNAIYRGSTDFALPTTTVISKTMYVQFIYNSADSKWDCVGLTNGF